MVCLTNESICRGTAACSAHTHTKRCGVSQEGGNYAPTSLSSQSLSSSICLQSCLYDDGLSSTTDTANHTTSSTRNQFTTFLLGVKVYQGVKGGLRGHKSDPQRVARTQNSFFKNACLCILSSQLKDFVIYFYSVFFILVSSHPSLIELN